MLRSAAKPFQALPLVADGATDHFGFSEEEIALCCGSHNSEEEHLRVVRSILDKAGVTEELLVCRPHRSLWRERERELQQNGTTRTPIMSNCSGKHAGMLALAAFHGWPLAGYQQMGHPVQEAVQSEMARWSGAEASNLFIGVDGCGVPCAALPLRLLALATARLVTAAKEENGAPQRVLQAMVHHPFMVAGSGRLCTRLMEAEEGRLIAKVGAEGVYIAGEVERGLGVALKVEDGAWRAAAPALLEVLAQAELLSEDARSSLSDLWAPPVTNTLGDEVGRLQAG